MARTPSNMLPLGTVAPAFTLLDTVSDKPLGLDELKSDVGTVIMFICNHCPYVVHIQAELTRLARDYQARGVAFIAISSNDVENYPQDSPQLMKVEAGKAGYTFPYLYDETQGVAKAYRAACTPDFYLFDGDSRLYYRGRLDAATPGNGQPNDGKDLRAALDALLAGKAAPTEQYPSMGCNIKWKK